MKDSKSLSWKCPLHAHECWPTHGNSNNSDKRIYFFHRGVWNDIIYCYFLGKREFLTRHESLWPTFRLTAAISCWIWKVAMDKRKKQFGYVKWCSPSPWHPDFKERLTPGKKVPGHKRKRTQKSAKIAEQKPHVVLLQTFCEHLTDF